MIITVCINNLYKYLYCNFKEFIYYIHNKANYEIYPYSNKNDFITPFSLNN